MVRIIPSVHLVTSKNADVIAVTFGGSETITAVTERTQLIIWKYRVAETNDEFVTIPNCTSNTITIDDHFGQQSKMVEIRAEVISDSGDSANSNIIKAYFLDEYETEIQ